VASNHSLFTVQQILMRDACLDGFTFQCVASLNDVISMSFWFQFVEMKPG